jgi:2-keto-4-pentenoate hydratase/2-oxohepta-3-ene-1,7-dioic acid hydratase in catechol pathway
VVEPYRFARDALVPESPFTLESGDIVEIEIDGIGALRNPVARGKTGRLHAPVVTIGGVE